MSASAPRPGTLSVRIISVVGIKRREIFSGGGSRIIGPVQSVSNRMPFYLGDRYRAAIFSVLEDELAHKTDGWWWSIVSWGEAEKRSQQAFGLRWQSEAATPLWERLWSGGAARRSESAVALCFPPQSKT